MNEQLKNLIQIYYICIIFGFILMIIRLYIINRDIYFLKKEIFNDCNYWCLSHYILYILLGFYAPKYWYISVIISFLWEYIEYIIDKNDFIGIGKYIAYSGSKDVKRNTKGLLIGILLNRLFNIVWK